MDTEFQKYHEYLLQRSPLGWIYRKFILYPFLVRNLRGKVVDIGCGIGDFIKFRGGETEGIDINPYNVNFCKKHGLKATCVKEYLYPFEANTIDGVVLDNVLEHLGDPSPLLKEVTRILKTGGVFIIGVPGTKGYQHDPDHKVFYDKEKLELLLASHGFKLKKAVYQPLNSLLLDDVIPQHCLYGIFEK